MSTFSPLAKLLPDSYADRIRQRRKYQRARARLRSLLRDTAGARYTWHHPGPAAPAEIVSMTALMKRDEIGYKAVDEVFHATGMSALAEFVTAATSAGLDLRSADAAFELGCGGGRLIRHLRGVRGLRLVGSDLIEENVSWCRRNLDGAEFHINELQPPLRFLDNDSIDFMFAYSVFTHVPMHLQLPWMSEVARVLKPGGVATVTVTGVEMARMMMEESEYREFAARGDYTLGPDHPRVSASSALIGSWDVFMTPERVEGLYGQALEVVAQAPGRQSVIVLRKRA